jgi:hypothetical protein
MTPSGPKVAAVLVAVLLYATPAIVLAHSGPPFPLISDRVAGPYQVSIWTDPDATDDGSAGGQFWVMIRLRDGSSLPPDTRALVAIRPADLPTSTQAAHTLAVNGDLSRQFVALLMDHEGPYFVEATITGNQGQAVLEASVDATYDLRPARWLLGLYLVPFLAVGFLWLKLLISRRRSTTQP